MGTSFLLLFLLISSIFLSRYVSNKINPPGVLPSEDQKDESLRKAKAAAVAVAGRRRAGRAGGGAGGHVSAEMRSSGED